MIHTIELSRIWLRREASGSDLDDFNTATVMIAIKRIEKSVP